MIVKINGKDFKRYENGIDVTPVIINEVIPNELDVKVDNIFRKYIIPTSTGIGLFLIGDTVFAEDGTKMDGLADKLMPLIKMIQDLALPIGIGVATWGLIEVIIGNFGSGKNKIKYAIIGFAGMFVIPEIFYAIRSAFQ